MVWCYLGNHSFSGFFWGMVHTLGNWIKSAWSENNRQSKEDWIFMNLLSPIETIRGWGFKFITLRNGWVLFFRWTSSRSVESTKAPIDEVRRFDGAVSQNAQEIHGIHMELLAETAHSMDFMFEGGTEVVIYHVHTWYTDIDIYI